MQWLQKEPLDDICASRSEFPFQQTEYELQCQKQKDILQAAINKYQRITDIELIQHFVNSIIDMIQ